MAVYYRGTSNPSARLQLRGNLNGVGVYFTQSFELACKYGSCVIAYEISNKFLFDKVRQVGEHASSAIECVITSQHTLVKFVKQLENEYEVSKLTMKAL